MEPPAYDMTWVREQDDASLLAYLDAYRAHVALESTDEGEAAYRGVCRSVAGQADARALTGGLLERLLEDAPPVAPRLAERSRVPVTLPARVQRWALARIEAGGASCPGAGTDLFEDPAVAALFALAEHGTGPGEKDLRRLASVAGDTGTPDRGRALAAVVVLFLGRFRSEADLVALYESLRDLRPRSVAPHVITAAPAGPLTWRRVADDFPRLVAHGLSGEARARADERLRRLMRIHGSVPVLERLLDDRRPGEFSELVARIADHDPERALSALEVRPERLAAEGLMPRLAARLLAATEGEVHERALRVLAHLPGPDPGEDRESCAEP